MLRALVAVLVASVLTAPEARAADCPWVGSPDPIESRVAAVLANMTLDDELAMVHGVAGAAPYAGRIPGNERLCIPGFLLHDGPNGVGGNLPHVTQLPAPVAAAATWDTGLARDYGTVEGAEQKAKGVTVALAPMVNIVRDPRAGRNFETYGEDPHLAARLGVANIRGIQDTGVMAQVKHFAAYNQESNRFSPVDNSVVSERVLREIYLPQFEAAVREAKASSVMCSYNWVNGVNACEHPQLLTGILREQWGFDGFVTSDWGGTKSTVDAAKAGLDMEMPTGTHFGDALRDAIDQGRISRTRLNDMVRNILRPMFRFGLFERPITGHPDALAATEEHAAISRKVAEDGAVLLKNDGVLPLQEGKTVAVIGRGGHAEVKTTGGLGNPVATPPGVESPLRAIEKRAGAQVTYAPGPGQGALPTVPADRFRDLTATFHAGRDLAGEPLLTREDQTVDFDWRRGEPAPGVPATDWSARWTGTLTPTESGQHTLSITSDDGSRLYVNGELVIDNWRDQGAHTETATVALTANQPVEVKVEYYQRGGDASLRLGWEPPSAGPIEQAVEAARNADAAVVFADLVSWEGFDLAGIDLPGRQNELISAVARANPNTAVVLQSGSAVTMPWLGEVKSVLQAWFPGQSIGPSLAALLYGDVNPSGKLPVTFPKSLADVPASTRDRFPGANGEVRYDEGLAVGYRWYDQENVEPLFPFGHGLSYTSFVLDRLTVTNSGPPVSVTARVTNVGARTGAEVVQVYVGFPQAAGEPPKQLKAFAKVRLMPGESRTVRFTLDERALSWWDGDWTRQPGRYRISVGTSSRELPLEREITLR